MRTFTVVFAALIFGTFSGCKKSTPSTPTVSNWTLKGTTYTSNLTTFSVKILIGADNSSNDISLFFSAKPTVSGVFAVRDSSPSSNTEVSIIASTATDDYYSVGGGNVNVTVAANGKLTATFTNISVRGFSGLDLQTVSGTLIEKLTGSSIDKLYLATFLNAQAVAALLLRPKALKFSFTRHAWIYLIY